MDFTFTEEQRSMAAACRELLDDVCSPESLRLASRGDATSNRWAKLAELGLTGMLAPAAAGGMALDDVDFILVAQEIGRAALPEALVDHAGIAVPLLAALHATANPNHRTGHDVAEARVPVRPDQSADVGSSAAGQLDRSADIGPSSAGRLDRSADIGSSSAGRLDRSADVGSSATGRLGQSADVGSSIAGRPEGSKDVRSRIADWLERAASGEVRIAVGASCNPFVLDAANADALLLQAGDEVHLVDRADVRLTAHASIDPLRSLSTVEWTPRPQTLLASGNVGSAAWKQAEERGAIYTAAQCTGLAERMIDLAVAYAAGRTQFGKPIGSYQALKHHLATVRVKLEFARALIFSAVTRVADADARAFAAVSSAKLAAGDAAELAARTSLQVHGAMGYSSEVDLHIYMKRTWALLGAWGDRNHHARRVQTLLFEGGLALGPDETFARRETER